MKKVVIVGAGGLGREVYSWIQHSNGLVNSEKLEVKGLVDDDPDALNGYDYPIKVISSIAKYIPSEDEYVIVAIGSPHLRRKIVSMLSLPKEKYISFVHPSVILGTNAKIGKGVVLFPGVVISCDAVVEDFVFINHGSSVGHDSRIGKYSTIFSKVEITGANLVGELVTFGVGSRTIPNIVIENAASVGAGSVVLRRVKSKTIVFGNPAKLL